jgi:hypothetical protein
MIKHLFRPNLASRSASRRCTASDLAAIVSSMFHHVAILLFDRQGYRVAVLLLEENFGSQMFSDSFFN